VQDAVSGEELHSQDPRGPQDVFTHRVPTQGREGQGRRKNGSRRRLAPQGQGARQRQRRRRRRPTSMERRRRRRRRLIRVHSLHDRARLVPYYPPVTSSKTGLRTLGWLAKARVVDRRSYEQPGHRRAARYKGMPEEEYPDESRRRFQPGWASPNRQ
jgi:hypothetical protein